MSAITEDRFNKERSRTKVDDRPGDTGMRQAAEEVLTGKRRGIRALVPFLGPAFVACVAYVAIGFVI